MLSSAFGRGAARRILTTPARQFAVDLSVGGQRVEVAQTGADGNVQARPLYFDNQSTTSIDPR